MPPLRFAHLADLHLDAPFHGISSLPAPIEAEVREASLRAWDNAVQACLAAEVAFVLIAGDVYEQEEAGLRAQLRFLRGLERLCAAGIPTLIVHGNHDPQGGRWRAIRAWPPGVTVFGHQGVATVPVQRDGEIVALVHGMSYPERHVTENLAQRFHRDPAHPGAYQIGLLHASLGEHPEHGRYAPCSLDDLRATGLDYWALGHVHTRQVPSAAFPAAVYPGNIQARHPGEEGPRGFYLVEAGSGTPPGLTFQQADEWRFATFRLDLGHQDPPPATLDGLVSLLTAAADQRRGEQGLIARAELLGSTPLHPDLNRPGAAAELLRHLREEAASATTRLWWDELRVRTHPPLDRAARLQAGDFLADLLRWSEGHAAEAQNRVRALLQEIRGRQDLAAIASELDWIALEGAADQLWREAEQLAFDLLEERGAAP